MTKTKAEIYQRCIKDKIIFAPIVDPSDTAGNPQLHARGFYVSTDHPELGQTLTYCGPFAQFSETPMRKWLRSPLIGEHNTEIYGKEMGFSVEQLAALKQANVI